jgi:hypothetical protein
MSRIVIGLVALTVVAHPREAPAEDAPAGEAPIGAAPSASAGEAPAETAQPAPAGEAPAETAQPAPASEAPAETAQPAPAGEGLAETEQASSEELGEQGIAPALGAAIGGRTTAGGLRVAGHYLYRLAEKDWFDGTVAFVFGTGGAECFRDRMDDVVCEHGPADGYSVELAANVRRYLGGPAQFWPFVRGGIGVAIVRFSDDDITGIAFPLHAGGGLRVTVADGLAIVGEAELVLGLARFSNGPGSEPQLGLNVVAGVEFRL